MEKTKKNEITRKLLKEAFIKGEEIKLVDAQTWRRKVGKFAEKLGVSLEDGLEFVDELVREMLEEMLDQSKFSSKE